MYTYMHMNTFDVEAGRPIVDRYVISELLDECNNGNQNITT